MKHRPAYFREQSFYLVFGDCLLLHRKILSVRLVGALAALVAMLGYASTLSAQSGQPAGTAPAQAAPPDATTALLHDLSGVWMQYPDGEVPGVPGMNAVTNRTRPPLTPWGQAKFDAARPLVGPRAVPG